MDILDIFNLNLTCREVDYPFCTLITSEFNKYASKPADLRFFNIYNPATIVLLLVEILCTMKMIINTKFKFSNVGRKEIIFFFYLLLCCLIMELLLVMKLFTNLHIIIQRILMGAFISLVNTTSFCMMIGGVLSTNLVYSSNFSIPLMRTMCAVSFVIFFGFFSIVTRPGFGILLFVGFFTFNLVCNIAFFFLLSHRLNKRNSDIWAFGSFLISFILYLISIVLNFFGSFIFFYISDGYLDSLFFINLSIFCSILMIHKLWDTINDTEEEGYIVQEPAWYNHVKSKLK